MRQAALGNSLSNLVQEPKTKLPITLSSPGIQYPLGNGSLEYWGELKTNEYRVKKGLLGINFVKDYAKRMKGEKKREKEMDKKKKEYKKKKK